MDNFIGNHRGKSGTLLDASQNDELSTPPGTPPGPSQLYSDNGFSYKYPESFTLSLMSEKLAAGEPMMDAVLPGPTKGDNPSDMFVSLYNQRSSSRIAFILTAAAIGVGLGVLFSHFELNGNWASWISLPGDLFISALKCLIGPMVFCSIVGCIGQLVEAGKAASIGGRIMSYFVLCSLVSSDTDKAAADLLVRCSNGQLLSMVSSGRLSCVEDTNTAESFGRLTLNDTQSYFASSGSKLSDLDVSEQLFSILNEIVPENMIGAFSSSSTMSVITLAVFFGAAVVMSHDRTRQQLAAGGGPAGTTKGDIEVNHLLLLVNHSGLLCQLMINSVVKLIPFAIISMIAGSMAKYSSSTDLVESMGFLILALALALVTLTYGIMGLALFVTTRVNVFTYLRHIIPAQVFIFGCSSSIATLPMTMRCVDSTREVSYALSRFMLPLGATSNLNGSACYMTLVCVFMARVGGYGDLLTPLRYGLLVVVGAIASFGVAPVPHSGLVMAITVWHTVFNMNVPPVFSLLVGADWLLNRMRAIVNITNDTILLRIIAAQCDETTNTELELEQQSTTVC
ncbi:hypothetical protein BBJ29_003971 [Phytophthora kernoviae]|uniref:Amino acid transporter n=1 Tax=Phytophthora kernoviae TaxID=325452 RepID=A0A3F2RKG7_9STRA|nr:hypothetical protein BBP00_00006681 [Phytophthora kernoviae]RLN71880.1 hypothetical protein BBJ29_003971 [Phytophthora kernoviae]